MTQYSASAWEAEWTAAGTPKGPVVRVRVDMAAASRQGRRQVADCGQKSPSCPRSRCVLSQGAPRPAACQPPASRRGPNRSPDKREDIARAAATIAEDEQRRMIAKFQPFVRVAAMSASKPARGSSPDHYGLRRHLNEQRTGAPRERALDARETRSSEIERRSRPAQARR